MVHTYTLSNGKEVKVTLKNKRVNKKFFGRDAEHYAYTVIIEVEGSKLAYKTTFHDSIANFRSGKGPSVDLIDDGVYSIIMDADSYKQCPKYTDFINELGYEDDAEGRRVYKACKETSDILNAMFTEEEIDSLYEECYEKKNR